MAVSLFADSSRKGNWWNHLPENQQLVYVLGMMDGREIGYALSILKLEGKDTGDFGCYEKVYKNFNETGAFYFGDITNSQIAAGVSAFYLNFESRSIDVSDVVWIVVNQLAGTSKADIQKMTRAFRKLNAAEKKK